MASVAPFKSQFLSNPLNQPQIAVVKNFYPSFSLVRAPGLHHKRFSVKAAAGELSSDSTTYLIAGAAAVALVGTAFPILFSRKDTCPECDGAGFVRKAGKTLRANAARKDQNQIVCANCNGLGKLNQVDK
ncbi:hypothetical protein BVRB_5g111610 [Beta vulgaris subsp. vulgaris]|uniref:uncharacterized protein LOC104893654 n=1 Tax=Beta vulgaris subsp. vulgaris TaxID=3555 RepID=UPI00053F3641|nr:uncharacterized protein LOC104893654 [Beta vulgaris subsp. vulgaris]KMT11073.1 hypothetical protein BVRB_5g111610 [Beta vulgaris subsp. vulgaris]